LYEGERCQQLKQRITRGFSPPPDFSVPVFPLLQRDLGLSPWVTLLANGGKLNCFMLKSGNAEQPDPDRTDILSLLLSARDQEGKPMTDQELRDELMS